MAKRKDEFDEEEFEYEMVGDDDFDDLEDAEDLQDDEDEEDEAEEEDKESDEAEQPPEEEPEEELPPDDKKAVAALRKLGVRLDVNEKGNVWRVIFNDMNGRDDALVLLKGLPGLKELWLIGTKVTPKAAEKFKEDHPKMTVYY